MIDNQQRFMTFTSDVNQTSPFHSEISTVHHNFTEKATDEEIAKKIRENWTSDYELLNKLPNNFGDALKMILSKKGIYQKDFAKLIGKSEVIISHYIANKKFPSQETLTTICLILNLNYDTSLFLFDKCYCPLNNIQLRYALQKFEGLSLEGARYRYKKIFNEKAPF